MSDMMSGVSGAGGGDRMRLVGMATGIDVDGTVKKMLLGEQKKVDMVKQQRQALEWKQEEYKEIIKVTKALQDKYFNVSSKDCLLKERNYSDFDVTSTLSSVATATASAGAVDGTYKFEVKSLAIGAKIESSKLMVKSENAKLTNTLAELSIVTNETKFQINGNDIIVNKSDKLSDLINKINNSCKGEVKARYSELTGKLTIETTKTGSKAELNLNNFPDKLKAITRKAQDAEVIFTESAGQKITEKYDGSNEGIKVIQSSNNFTIDGVSYNLKGTGATTVSVTGNADKTFDRIKGFLDDYNALVGTINEKLKERKDYSYKPLTENQKKQMKDNEIKAWEARAKKGILRNDPNLQRMLRELRGTFFDEVKDSAIKFGKKELGLDTTNDLATAGQIKFGIGGEEKLKKALREKPEEIMKLFTKSSTADDKKAKYNESGIVRRIDSIFRGYVGSPGVTLDNAILTKYANKHMDSSYAGTGGTNTIPDQIYRKDKMIKDLNAKMRAREEQLYKQFSRLETIMNRYNAQAGWLSQQFGGGM